MNIMMLTVIGACASSTGGGIKVSRLLVGIKCVKREIVQLAASEISRNHPDRQKESQ